MTVGESLASARSERGLSVDDLSEVTRIRAGLIRRIEADDFEGCGGAVYARGHIRSLAKAVGIDPEPLVAEYDRAHTDEVPPTVTATLMPDTDAIAHADRKRPNWTAAMVAVLVAVCVLAGVSLATGGGGGKGTSAKKNDRPAPVHTASSTPPPSSAPAASPPPDAVANVPRDAAIALVRVTSSQTWMSVSTFSGKVLFEGLLSSGQRKIFKDNKGLRLTIGNAPVVDLVANGRDVGAPKSQGNVARLSIPRGGAIQYA